MDIAMLGISNAGKTSYVTAMYGAMSKDSGPFTVLAQRQADHQWLTRNAMALARGQYPPPSDHRSAYSFTLHYNRAPFLDFVWRDYRGGALTELSHESAEAGQLSADLGGANGVVILVDSTLLMERVRARTKLRPVIAAAVRVLTQRTATTPVVIALTKWDLVSGREEEVETIAADVLGDLVAALSDSEYVHGCMVPISCGPESVNIELPVLWCIHIGILEHYHAIAWEAEMSEKRAAQALGQRGVLKDIGRWLSGTPTATEAGRFHLTQAALRRAYLEPIVEPANRLGAIFTNVFTF
jgi:hypothetical protein